MGDTIKLSVEEHDAEISQLWAYRVKAEALDKIKEEIESLGLSKAAIEIIAKAYAKSEEYQKESDDYQEENWTE